MGRNAIKYLLTYDFIEKIIIADINEEKAKLWHHTAGL